MPTFPACLLLHPLQVPSNHLPFDLQHWLLLWLKTLYLLEIIFHLLSLTTSGKDNAISHTRMRMQPPLNTASGPQLLRPRVCRDEQGQCWAELGSQCIYWAQVQKAQGLLRVCETSTWPRKQAGVSKWPPSYNCLLRYSTDETGTWDLKFIS